MKKIFLRTCAFTFITAAILAGCTSDNTTGVETEGTETETNMESDPNMGGKTGNTGTLDSLAIEGDTTQENNMDTEQ